MSLSFRTLVLPWCLISGVMTGVWIVLFETSVSTGRWSARGGCLLLCFTVRQRGRIRWL